MKEVKPVELMVGMKAERSVVKMVVMKDPSKAAK